MIKLIVSDMDGTLLTPQRTLPPHFFEVMEACRAKGAQFAIGSGRSYRMLDSLFGDAVNDMMFICDNGAHVVMNGKTAETSPMKREDWLKSAADIDALGDGARAILCGVKGVYVHSMPKEAAFSSEITDYYRDYHTVENFADIDDDIIKTAICTLGASDEVLETLQSTLPSSLCIVLSGPHYLDVMRKDVSKGSALKRLQQRLGAADDETMVFGDYYNDIEMLKLAKYSFIMENAVPEMFAYGSYKAPSNADYGVLKVLEKHIINGEEI